MPHKSGSYKAAIIVEAAVVPQKLIKEKREALFTNESEVMSRS